MHRFLYGTMFFLQIWKSNTQTYWNHLWTSLMWEVGWWNTYQCLGPICCVNTWEESLLCIIHWQLHLLHAHQPHGHKIQNIQGVQVFQILVTDSTWHTHQVLNSEPSNELGWNALALTKWLELGLALRAMAVVVEQDVLGLWQLSPKLICIRIIPKYGILHYSTLIRVVESYTMVLIQHQASVL